MQKKTNKYSAQRALIEGENINVSSTNDGKDFLILFSSIVCGILIFLFSFDFISAFFIDRMSTEAQLKLESIFSQNIKTPYTNPKYDKYINRLNQIKKVIIYHDKTIQNKSNFDIELKRDRSVNAMIAPNGKIVFTTGLLDKNLNDQELTFILAHEIGHYSNRDHLKSISKQVGLIVLFTLTGLNNNVQVISQGISEIQFLNHSREQEKKADLYAGNFLIKLYGTNEAGRNFLKKFKMEEKTPEFMNYFSTHPSWEERYKLLETQQNNL